jgi:TetR/AcrR family transcriptional regulator, mexJK operon transcriptional repressor
MNELTAISRPRAGRPTREQAEARHSELLEVALDHFLDRGYEVATIDAIASAVSMTKRTVYGLYADKTALFRAAVHSAIERYAISEERIAAADCGELEQTLRNIARLRIDLVASEQGIKLQRIINTESYRFPDIFTENYELGALPTIRFLARLLERETAAGRLAVTEPDKAATVFMSMVVSGPVRIIVSGNSLSEAEIDQRVAFAVQLFLNGARLRDDEGLKHG